MPRTKIAKPRIRAAALAVRDDRILLARHRKGGREYYLLPGGGVEEGELARDTLVRELREEAGVDCEIRDLRYVVETRSPDGGRHVLQLVFETGISGEIGASTDPRVAGCAWHAVEDLRRLKIHPDVGVALADDIAHGDRQVRYLVAVWRP